VPYLLPPHTQIKNFQRPQCHSKLKLQTCFYSNFLLLFTITTGLIFSTPNTHAELTIRTYEKIDDNILIINPGIGLSNFHHSHNNKKSRPTGKTAYYRFYWNEIENNKLGAYDFSKIDNALALATQRNEMFGFRIMAAKPQDTSGSNYVKIPSSLIDETKNTPKPVGKFAYGTFIPDFNHPKLINAAQNLIAELGKRYGNNPNVYFVDIGLVGYWGEWHLGGLADALGLPNIENAKRYIDMHTQAFPKKQNILLLGNGTSTSINTLNYATSKYKVGWRADGWGDYRFLDDAHDNYTIVYTKILNQVAALNDQWHTSPILLETYSTLSAVLRSEQYITKNPKNITVRQADNINKSFEFAVAQHVSSINTPPDDEDFNTLPARVLRDYTATIAKLGYRFHLQKSEINSLPTNKNSLKITTHWQNIGNAPSYGNFKIAYRLRNNQNKTALRVIDNHSTTDKWLPSSNFYTQTTVLDAASLAGNYFVDCAILTQYNYPIELANKNKLADNWTEIGKIKL
jgi:hypothetical protein